MVIVCIGDSITFGQFLPDGKPWPKLIRHHTILAAGVPSDTTRLGLERFPEDVQQRAPQGVVIQFGHNDANRWQTDKNLPRVSAKAYAANLEEMVDRCHRFEAYPFLCTITPCYRSSQHAADVEHYDEVLRDVARYTKTQLIDVRAAFGEQRHLLLDDGLHLSQEGHARYAATVQRALDGRFLT